MENIMRGGEESKNRQRGKKKLGGAKELREQRLKILRIPQATRAETQKETEPHQKVSRCTKVGAGGGEVRARVPAKHLKKKTQQQGGTWQRGRGAGGARSQRWTTSDPTGMGVRQ